MGSRGHTGGIYLDRRTGGFSVGRRKATWGQLDWSGLGRQGDSSWWLWFLWRVGGEVVAERRGLQSKEAVENGAS